MKLSFLGGARTVTGSMHLLEVNNQRVLLDCGLFQGRRAESEQRNLNLPFGAHCANALILSHAHIDYSGNIPTLVRGGFVGDILCTPATRDLTGLMLRDSAHIQQKDVEYVNKVRARHAEPPVAPLYTIADAEQVIQYLVGRAYHRPFEVVPGVRGTFFDAGHILGSAFTVLEVGEHGRTIRLAFSGDPRHTILLVGFQSEHTLGRKLADGLKRVRIFGEEYAVRAQVERIDGFSAHADRDELLAWVDAAKDTLRGVFVVHGEEPAALALAAGIRALGVREVCVPRRGEAVTL